MAKSRPTWYRFGLLTLFLAMTAVCLVSWRFTSRDYLLKGTQLVMSKGSASVEKTTSWNWYQLYADGIVLLLILVSLAIVSPCLKNVVGRYDR